MAAFYIPQSSGADDGSRRGRRGRESEARRGATEPKGSNDPVRILLVEDDPDTQEIYTAILKHAGYEVAVFANGVDAIVHAADHSPDLILMDLQLPHMNGFEAIRLLKKIESTRDTPIVMVSASGREQMQRARQLGCEAFLQKPISPSDLLDNVRRHVESEGRV